MAQPAIKDPLDPSSTSKQGETKKRHAIVLFDAGRRGGRNFLDSDDSGTCLMDVTLERAPSFCARSSARRCTDDEGAMATSCMTPGGVSGAIGAMGVGEAGRIIIDSTVSATPVADPLLSKQRPAAPRDSYPGQGLCFCFCTNYFKPPAAARVLWRSRRRARHGP